MNFRFPNLISILSSNFSFSAFTTQEKHIFTHLCLNLEHSVLSILVCSFSWLRKKSILFSLFFFFTSACKWNFLFSWLKTHHIVTLFVFWHLLRMHCEKWQLDQACESEGFWQYIKQVIISNNGNSHSIAYHFRVSCWDIYKVFPWYLECRHQIYKWWLIWLRQTNILVLYL